MSHPVWVCGLKPLPLMMASLSWSMSHPVWVCGLKLATSVLAAIKPNVTPCMCVWIETPEVNLSHSLKTYRVSSLRSNFNSLF